MSPANRFVKSGDTKTPVGNSRSELEKMLRRYGASGFSVAQDYALHRVVISFIVPDKPGKDQPNVPVRLHVEVRNVYDQLYGRPMKTRWAKGDAERNAPPFNGRMTVVVHDPAGYDPKKLEQAERVAWRHLVLWVDAALTAAFAGMQSITEAFFAHTVIPGESMRMIDMIEQRAASLPAGVRALLASPAEEA